MRDAVWWPKNWTNIWSSLFFFLFAYNFVQISKANKSKPSLKIGSVNKAFFVLIYHDIDNGLENIFLGIKLFFSRWKTETFSICLKKNLLNLTKFRLKQTTDTKNLYEWSEWVVSKYAKRYPKDGDCCPNFQWRFCKNVKEPSGKMRLFFVD